MPVSAGRPSRPGRPAATTDFVTKMARILAPYDQSAAGRIPDGGRVICVDEFGPLNLQPRPGRGWFPSGRPARQRATYHRTAGVRHMIAALDLVVLCWVCRCG